MDIDAIADDVAEAVGLAEGPSGVRDILRVIALSEPVPASQISRMAELPVPIVTAVCNELRKRAVVDRSRPVRLTEEARARLSTSGASLDPACDCCGGLGLRIPAELAALGTELEQAAAGAPPARLELDQTHCTIETKIHRVLRLHQAGALDGTKIVLLGDDDLIAVTIARFARLTGTAAAIRGLTVIDTDPAVLAWTAEQCAGTGVAVEVAEHDLRLPLPEGLAGRFDVACTDPPYTVPGAELFLSRAVAALRPRPGQHVFFSFGARRPAETLRTQQLIAALGLVVRSLTPNFNSYLGAGILAGTSHLYHLRSTDATAPLTGGEYAGPLYTADSRTEQIRPYRCAGCGTVYQVGRAGPAEPRPQWTQISELQAAGCPACGGTTFRPMPRRQR
ncbi:MAG TPA: bis-aminopropyl spermidine synthase family protein [Streptosporangiaceae bacterium]|nr:bis-aminopropyl spermidine synthase family protein [Streptosporangiaceae bacterium]